MNIPPITNPAAYATPLLKAWKAELEQRQARCGRPGALLARITVELTRRRRAKS